MNKLIGVVSDTHGILRKEVADVLRSCDAIVHAGDIGSGEVLEALRKIADVVAVKGNVDKGFWTAPLHETECVEYNGRRICVIHNIGCLDIDPKAAGVDIVIYGHSHRPSITYRDNILYLNPGSAGPKRFDLPVSMACISIKDKEIFPEIVEIKE